MEAHKRDDGTQFVEHTMVPYVGEGSPKCESDPVSRANTGQAQAQAPVHEEHESIGDSMPRKKGETHSLTKKKPQSERHSTSEKSE